MKHSPTPLNSIKIALLSALIGSSLTVSATALGNEGFQSPLQRSASVSSLIQVEGLSQAEKTRLRGFLRTAAYGESAPGAVRISANLLDAVANDGRGSTRKAKPKPNDDGECFFQVPERFSLFKATTDRDPCAGLGTLLIADTETQILYLCKNGKSVKDFDFAKGWNGTAKREEGDERTPLGVYNIKAPQKSSSGFHKFIHISYPTPHQKSQGYTGSNVGIHGPSRWARCLGRLNTYVFDWTNGCIAVGSDREIDEVSRFVEENTVTKLAVYPLEETGNSLAK
ncbi:MAG: L,D-transpeptidase family protein [Deltaproteobacteria bacterium]|nr:L,D-transpeptidase family protein [Deltaproteobacteria bacterium]